MIDINECINKSIVFEISSKMKVLQFLNFCFSVLVNDRLIKIPVVGGVGFYNLDVTEKWMISVMEQLSLPENTVFVDVGVNIGQTLMK